MADKRLSLTLPDGVVAAALLALAAWLAAATWTYAGIDLYNDYLPWFTHITQRGFGNAFAMPFGSYAPPYLYLLAVATPLSPTVLPFSAVKMVSYAGHGLLVLSARNLLRVCGCSRPWTGAGIVGLAPSLFINPAILVQCDAYWAAALVAALAAALEARHARMLLLCGLAVGFKLQAVFAAPLFLSLALADRVPARLWLLAPAGYLATLLPAWLAGWPASDLLAIYFRQIGFSARLSLAAPNIWTLVEDLATDKPACLAAIGSIAALIAGIAYVIVFARRLRGADQSTVLHAASLCAVIVPGLLPHMHERYFFLADVLTIVLAFVGPGWWMVAGLVQFGSFAAIWGYLTGATGLADLAAAAMMTTTWLLLRPCFVPTATILIPTTYHGTRSLAIWLPAAAKPGPSSGPTRPDGGGEGQSARFLTNA